jgi:hypothetical protein
MRVNLITQSSAPSTFGKATIPLSLTIRPACGMPGDYQYMTDSAALLEILRQQTDLPSSVIMRFEGDLYTSANARLLGVDLSEHFLTEIGYFID